MRYSVFGETYLAEHPEHLKFWQEWWDENEAAIRRLLPVVVRDRLSSGR